MHIYLKILRVLFIAGCFLNASCEKLVEIDEPVSSIPTSKVFANDNHAISAMMGVYYNMINTPVLSLTNGAVTVYAGLSSDELDLVDAGNAQAAGFAQNSLLPNNIIVYTNLWSSAYSIIYHANAVLEGLSNTSAISDSLKTQLTAEAKLTRALIHFYLVNLYGDIPFVNSTDWRKSGVSVRLPDLEIYQLILKDLNEAQAALPAENSTNNTQRTTPNRMAAISLLARVHLYLREWTTAEENATKVINAGLYNLMPALNDVFSPDNPEAIWQLQHDITSFSFNGTKEGETLVPFDGIIPFPPFASINSSLLASFEVGDNRREAWINSREISGITLYYPYKYKIGASQAIANGPYTEYYTILRLAEQYLIRAEARANLGNLSGAIADLNLIRQRAGLQIIHDTLTQEEVLQVVKKERRVELFSEWGHRWFDVKRWGIAVQEVSNNKGIALNEDDLLYPIPINELQTNPNLTQNNGY